VRSKQREHACDHERRASRESRPGNGASDRANAVADRQADKREEAEEADRNEGAHEQALQDAAGSRWQSLLVRAHIEGEEGRQQREPARVDNREAAGDERDRDRNGADPRSS